MGYIKKSGIMAWDNNVISTTPNIAGVYVLRDLSQNIIYIGSAGAGRLRERLLEHLRATDVPGVRYFDWYQTAGTDDARSLESNWLNKYRPKHNDIY